MIALIVSPQRGAVNVRVRVAVMSAVGLFTGCPCRGAATPRQRAGSGGPSSGSAASGRTTSFEVS
ncbi:hypothetical protein ADL05_01155 [Nocardiopsis sp. NRRL B-16309]|nr:hypothetical protein ADL05_01155 [Nocardiopsis sp. NRRL B-16309]